MRKYAYMLLLTVVSGLSVVTLVFAGIPEGSRAPITSLVAGQVQSTQTAASRNGQSVQNGYGAEGVFAVVTQTSAYAWSNITGTWHEVQISGRPIKTIISHNSVGILADQRAYAWNSQIGQWTWTHINGRPQQIVGSRGNIAVLTDMEAYAWDSQTGTWQKTQITRGAESILGQDQYDRQLFYPYTEYAN